MLHVFIFYAAQLVVSLYAIQRGGAPERAVAVMMIAAALASTLAPFDYWRTFRTVNWPEFYIDLVLLVGLVVVAARADRFWPIWLAALHLLAIGIHGVRAYDTHIWAIVYGRAGGMIAYPMLVLLLAGTIRHQRRVRDAGTEAGWTHARGLAK